MSVAALRQRRRRLQLQTRKGLDECAWRHCVCRVALDELLAELKGKAGCFHLYLEVNSSGTRHHYRGSKKHIRLHPNFARSLRLAQARSQLSTASLTLLANTIFLTKYPCAGSRFGGACFSGFEKDCQSQMAAGARQRSQTC